MNRLFLCLMLGIFVFSITQISAVELNGGECNSFEFQNSNPVNFKLTSNTTELVDFNWTQSGKIITYCFSIAQSEGNFTLQWFNKEAVEEKKVEESGGGTGKSEPYVTPKEDIEKGIEKTMEKGRTMHFSVVNEHKLTIKDVTEDEVIFLIESEPVEMTLKENETKSECISESEKVQITNLNIIGEYAHFTLKSIDASDCKTQEKETPDKEQPKKDDEQEKPKEENEDSNFNFPTLLLGLFLILIVVVGVIVYIKHSKRENSSSESNDELNDGDNNEQK